jgi:zinc transporter ZupT
MEGVVVNVTTDGNEEGKIDRDESLIEFSPCHTCSEDPVKDLQRIQTMANEIEEKQHLQEQTLENQHTKKKKNNNNSTDSNEDDENDIEESEQKRQDDDNANAEAERAENKEKEQKKLTVLGINTAIAIGLHNFPEGLATFVAVLNDPKVGFVLALAIAIHNIPEGICVALPVYYASGSRRKAFLLALLSGISEPIAALFGYLILASIVSDSTFAVLYGIVSGMMIIICTRELLPTAHRYDPEDTYVTTCYITGMALMALALVLFLS